MGKLESLGDELVAAEFVVTALAIGIGLLATTSPATTVADSFVDNIPGIDDILVAVHYCMDMFAQALVEYLLLHILTFLVCEHPVGKLGVPTEAMTTQLDAVLTAEVGNLIGFFPVPLSLLGMQLAGLHVVLSCDAVELALDQTYLVVIAHVTLVEGDANHEVVLVGIFQFDIRIGVCGCASLCP